MNKIKKIEISIENISRVNVHHQSNTSSPIYSLLQLESGVVVIGLYNGFLYFYAQNALKNPYSSLKIDKFPINSIIQVQDDQLLCTSGSLIYLIFENNLKKLDYNKKEKIVVGNIFGKINKILLLPDDSLIIGDNKFISLYKKKGKKINYIKQIKVGSPILDLVIIQSNLVLAASPEKKCLFFIDLDKFGKNYEINNIKFFQDISFGNLIIKIEKDLLVIGGCVGIVYLISLKNKQMVANVNIRYKNEIITAMHRMNNGDLLCATSMILRDENTKNDYICSNLVQYRYENNIFKEICRKENAHDDVVKRVCEIINHRGIGEIGTISLDSNFKVWD
jgi:WD40 repeat protein